MSQTQEIITAAEVTVIGEDYHTYTACLYGDDNVPVVFVNSSIIALHHGAQPPRVQPEEAFVLPDGRTYKVSVAPRGHSEYYGQATITEVK